MNETSKKRPRSGNRKGNRKDYRRKGSQRDSRGSDSADRDVRNHCGNDPMWYASNAQLLKDAASLAYSNPLGSIVPPPVDIASWSSDSAKANPGILTLEVLTTPGISQDNSSPINVAARSTYSFVRHANSGHSNYDSPDLMLYFLAVDSCYAAWAWMVRAYGIIRTYARYNRYYAQSVVEAMGLAYNDLLNNIADFRAFINTFAFKLGSICIPNKLSFIDRHIWQMSTIWTDGPGKKAQTYMYVPATFWMYDETTSELGGQLVPYNHPSAWGGLMTYSGVRNMCNKMIARILESEDMMIMSGDILKAYGDSAIQHISTIPEDALVVPQFSAEVCSQFQNAISTGVPVYDSLIISQDPDTNAIMFNPYWEYDEEHYIPPKSLILNLRSDDPTPEDTMVATRCMVMPVIKGENVYLNTCGSDIVTRIRYHVLTDTGLRSNVVPSFVRITHENTGVEVMNILRILMEVEKFDWHPYTYVSYLDDDTSLYYVGSSGDVDNFTYVGEYELTKMNECALLSQFGHDNMGAFVSNSK